MLRPATPSGVDFVDDLPSPTRRVLNEINIALRVVFFQRGPNRP